MSAKTSIFSNLDLPQNLPLTLPRSSFEQRPDVREYESLLHQASAGIGVATANMLPQFTNKRRSWHLCGSRDEILEH